jgi:hypothetical protein
MLLQVLLPVADLRLRKQQNRFIIRLYRAGILKNLLGARNRVIRIHWYTHSSPPPSSLLYGKMGSITLVFFSNGYIRYDTTFYA